MASGKVRVGLIGAGWWATYAHIPGLRSHPDAEITAVARRSPDKLAAVAARYGIPTAFTDYREMLATVELDAAIVATTHSVHYEAAKAALERGLHVLIEKPMTIRPEQARELVALAAEAGKQIVMSYPFHYTPHGRAAREAIRGGEIGDVQLISSLFASNVYSLLKGEEMPEDPEAYPFEPPARTTYSDPALTGGGQGQTQVTHPAAFAFWVTGDEPTSVTALMANGDLQVDLCDAIAYRCASGAIGTIASTGAAGITHSIGTSSDGRHQHLVFGSRGSLAVDLERGLLTVKQYGKPERTYEPSSPDDLYPRFAPVQNLVECALGRQENLSPGEYGLHSVRLVAGAYRSAACGQTVDV